MKQKLFLVFALLIAAIGTTSAQQRHDIDDDYATTLPKKGTVAPAFKMKRLDGKTFQLKQLKGHYVVLDFWASWCPDCRKDIPNIERIYKKFHPLGVEFVGVSMDHDRDAWEKAVEKYAIPYTQVSELKKFRETDIKKLYGVEWIPSMILLDKEGKVVLSTVLSDKLEVKLTELFATNKVPSGTTQTLTLQGSKGRLAAVVQKPVLADGKKCPMAMLLHGFTGKKESKLLELIADSLQANGVASIRFDFNGHGQSEGKFSEMTVPNEIEDAKCVFKYVRALPFVSDIYIAGHSQGGVVASMTAGELSSEISKVVLLAPAGVLRDDIIRGRNGGKQYDALNPPDSVAVWGNYYIGRGYITTGFSLPIYKTAAKYKGKACVIHGTGDTIVPYTYGERYQEIWPSCEYHQLDGFDHGFSQNIYRAADIATQFFLKE